MRKAPDTAAREPYYHDLGIGTSVAGGLFGLPGLLVELPITTTLMLSAIADIARSEGEDIHSVEARLACMEVFALGGRSEEDDAADTGYYGLRLALALPVSAAARHLRRHGLNAGGPTLIDLITVISSRFGVTVSEKAAAQLVPLGAAVNSVFIHHFQSMARHHFTIRRLERKYGPELVRRAYEQPESKPSAATMH